ncbi:hypothetical protein [Methylorubrum sp. POS3]|uniref:hypothetical protein n=1 Tax=Methylorubrum sp. POS3 TaxID=2998492 RepID=UPI00372B47B1
MEDAANAFGLSPKGYEKLEYSERGLSLERIIQASKIYSVSVEEVLAVGEPIKIVGVITHGGVIHYHDESLKLEIAPRPSGQFAHAAALRVDKGVALPGIALEDFIVYYGEKHDGVSNDFISKLCVVKVRNGDTLVRRIFEGGKPDNFDLVGVGLETIRNAEIEWSARVEWIKPS